LEKMLRSVQRQSLDDWELCLVDDCSREPHVREVLERVAATDPRIRVERREVNGGIVAASNDALRMARGEFVALLDHDDELHPDALLHVAAAIDGNPEADYVYTDEDKMTAKGHHAGPFLKPDWSPERMRTQMYTCHLSVLRRSLVEEVGGFDPDCEGAQDWDLVLKVTERARAVLHVPRILYHWRGIEGSTAAAAEEGGGETAKPWAFEAGARAIAAHCERTGVQATVARDPGDPGVYHLNPALRSEPLVSIVIPTNGQKREVRYQQVTLVGHCVRSIVADSTYRNFEIVVVADADTPAAAIAEIEAAAGDRLRLVPYERPFSFAEKINVGAVHSRGEHLLLLNDDIEVATPNWIERMVMYSALDGVGAVGGLLLLEDGRIQHAGVGFEGGLPGHPYYGYPRDVPGYANAVRIARDLLAVTGACLMTRRELFEEVGGLSTVFPINYNDVDYCLKQVERGRRVVYDPDLVMTHFESSSRSSDVADWEKAQLLHRWAGLTTSNRFGNPYLKNEIPRAASAFLWAKRRKVRPRKRRPPPPGRRRRRGRELSCK
ncbi:MAG TPA: glycosyltransferase, partial [Solirubrobacterales bacterium]|nr:glycosyltransferase [Solirubrobacterales bacterium]